MAETYGLVTVQICILILFGLWPLWSRPFTRNKIRNIFIVTYNGILLILWSWAYVIQFRQTILYQDHATLATFLGKALPALCDFGLAISLLHISIFKFSHLSNSLQLLTSYSNQNRKYTIYLIIGTINMLSLYGYLLNAWIQTRRETFSIENEAFHPFSITGSMTEAYVYFWITSIMFTPGIIYIPTIITLGLSFVIHKEFSILKSQILDAIDSKQLCETHTKVFSPFKRKYEEICDTVTCIDETFRYYIVACTASIGVNTFGNIYFQTVSCYPQDSFVPNLILYFSTFFILCASGVLVTRMVGICIHKLTV